MWGQTWTTLRAATSGWPLPGRRPAHHHGRTSTIVGTWRASLELAAHKLAPSTTASFLSSPLLAFMMTAFLLFSSCGIVFTVRSWAGVSRLVHLRQEPVQSPHEPWTALVFPPSPWPGCAATTTRRGVGTFFLHSVLFTRLSIWTLVFALLVIMFDILGIHVVVLVFLLHFLHKLVEAPRPTRAPASTAPTERSKPGHMWRSSLVTCPGHHWWQAPHGGRSLEGRTSHCSITWIHSTIRHLAGVWSTLRSSAVHPAWVRSAHTSSSHSEASSAHTSATPTATPTWATWHHFWHAEHHIHERHFLVWNKTHSFVKLTPSKHSTHYLFIDNPSRIILEMGSSSERRRYISPPPIGSAHAQNDPCQVQGFREIVSAMLKNAKCSRINKNGIWKYLWPSKFEWDISNIVFSWWPSTAKYLDIYTHNADLVQVPYVYGNWRVRHPLIASHRCIEPGGWFYIKMPSYQYRKSHCWDKTILRPSYLLRRSYDRRISTMGFPILVRRQLYTESGPWLQLPLQMAWLLKSARPSAGTVLISKKPMSFRTFLWNTYQFEYADRRHFSKWYCKMS